MRHRFVVRACSVILPALLIAFSLQAHAAPAPIPTTAIPIKDFANFSEFKIVKISPTGEFLAVTFDGGDQDYLVTLSTKGNKILGKQGVGKGFRIPGIWWVGPNRVIFSLAEQQGSLAQPAYTGELLGVDADGASAKYLFGYRAPETKGTHLQTAERRYASANVITTLPDDPGNVLISIRDWRDGEKQGAVEIARLNVNTGAVNSIDTAPTPLVSGILADDAGIPRYVTGEDPHGESLAFVRLGADRDWHPLNTGEFKKAKILPQHLSADGKRAFVLSDQGGDHLCLFETNLQTGDSKKITCDPNGDIDGVTMSLDRQEVIAVQHAGTTRYLETTHPDRERLQRLTRSFPGQEVILASATRDSSLAVVFVHSDRNPGDFYLFSPKTLKAEYLASRRSWIDPDQQARRRPIDFKTRDGETIHGVLTMPLGRAEKNLPLIVNPHGGPFGIYDERFWDEEPELFASRGYAVLQVNYRGSGGYGRQYQEAGRKGWDSVMINDITDATRSLIKDGTADGARVCIDGGSYGGYASLMSALKEPDLYRCVVAYAGVYDLGIWKNDSDVSENEYGRNYINEFIGDPERLKKASPLSYIDQLKAPVFIVHGTSDERVPITQARALRKAMDARKLPYEQLIKDDEGHGFYKLEDKIELDTKTLAFFEKYIGPGAPAVTAPAATTAGTN